MKNARVFGPDQKGGGLLNFLETWSQNPPLVFAPGNLPRADPRSKKIGIFALDFRIGPSACPDFHGFWSLQNHHFSIGPTHKIESWDSGPKSTWIPSV